MRCTICDWSPLTQSEFYGSLYVHGKHNSLVRDRKTGDLYCTECFEGIKTNYEDMKINDETVWLGIRSSNEHLFSNELEVKKVKEDE